MIKKFKCGICEGLKKENPFRTRKELRKHLREEHNKKQELTNFELKGKNVNQSWWKEEEFK